MCKNEDQRIVGLLIQYIISFNPYNHVVGTVITVLPILYELMKTNVNLFVQDFSANELVQV